MVMTEFEITRSYNSSGRKNRQLNILAVVNGTSVEHIEKVIDRYEKQLREKDKAYKQALKKHRVCNAINRA